MLKVKFGTAESKLKKHIGTDHSFCAQRRSDHAEKQNLLSAVPQFTFSIHAIYFQQFLYYQHRLTPNHSSTTCWASPYFPPNVPHPILKVGSDYISGDQGAASE